MENNALGRQLMVEYFNCSSARLNDVQHIRQSMLDAAQATGATVVGEVFHQFNPHGVSGVVVIAESHLAIHTWPEYGYAAVDLFTCGNEIDPYKGFEALKRALRSGHFEVREFLRGQITDRQHPLLHKPALAEADWMEH